MKRAVITGGNKGIGLEVTKNFIDNKNYETVVVGRDFSNFEYKNVTSIEFDLSQGIEQIDELTNLLGEVDVLINNAGVMKSLPWKEYDEIEKQKLLNVNLFSPIRLVQKLAPKMIKRKSGRIVNVASVAAFTGHPDIWYGVSKSGMINATKSFAKILGPYGLQVNCVAPSGTETGMLTDIPEERRNELKENTILKRFALPNEVAKVVYWLATESPDYVNGITIDVNNGAYMR